MRKEFENYNHLEKKVALNIRVPKNFDAVMERRINEALANLFYDHGCELVDSSEYRTVSIPDIQDIDFGKLCFRDFDDTGEPLQFFLGYNAPIEQIQKIASLWGYKGELCRDIELCLDLFSLEECPVEAVLSFNDNEQRWVDLRAKENYLPQLIPIVEHTGTGRSREAMRLFKELTEEYNASLTPKDSLSSQIQSAAAHAEKLQSSIGKQANKHSPER